MSRQIDLTKPLSDEDREYLLARNRKRDVAIADANAAGEDAPRAPLPDDAITSSTDRSPEAQAAAQGAREAALAAPTRQAGDGESQGGSGAEGSTDGDDESDNYDDESVWSYEDLKTEVKDREAEDKPALNSSREVFVAWLREDDAAE